jgi:hypothetical protein
MLNEFKYFLFVYISIYSKFQLKIITSRVNDENKQQQLQQLTKMDN